MGIRTKQEFSNRKEIEIAQTGMKIGMNITMRIEIKMKYGLGIRMEMEITFD